LRGGFILLAALLAILLLFRVARADDGRYTASAYGDGVECCSGQISRDGHVWERFDWASTVSVAHIWLPRGTRIILWIPPWEYAHTWQARIIGAVVSVDEHGWPLTISDSCWFYVGAPCPPNQVDLSWALLVQAGMCDPAPADSPLECLRQWGRRTVYLWIIEPPPLRWLPHFG